MRDLAILAIHLIATIAKLLLPGGARSVLSESLLLKHQLLILNWSRVRAPNLRPIDRIIASLCASLMRPTRLLRSAIVLKPSTLMAFASLVSVMSPGVRTTMLLLILVVQCRATALTHPAVTRS
jgi:hypothetical protein